jgi:hypothetical protein
MAYYKEITIEKAEFSLVVHNLLCRMKMPSRQRKEKH